jgi:hypothetical protein
VEATRHARKAIRFPLEAPIVFWWTDTGVAKRSEGRTHDISEMGAFVLAHACPPPGIQIGFQVSLPVLPDFESKARVEAAGQVLRVEQAEGLEGRNGFAISTRHTLLRISEVTHELKENSKKKSQAG